MAPSQLLLKSKVRLDEAATVPILLDANGEIISNKDGKSVQEILNDIIMPNIPSDVIVNTIMEREKKIKAMLARPFKVPIAGYTGVSDVPLGVRRQHVIRPLHDPNAEDAFVLYAPEIENLYSLQAMVSPAKKKVHVVVDPILTKVLRPHQREGVQFLFDCAIGRRDPRTQNTFKTNTHETDENTNPQPEPQPSSKTKQQQPQGEDPSKKGSLTAGQKIPPAVYTGCIMADDMGLGKTLQTITFAWTVLKQGQNGLPIANKAIVVAPSSLVKNWDNEFKKWLGFRVSPIVMDGGASKEIKQKLDKFVGSEGTRSNYLLIISYETFRLYSDILSKREIGLLICDEGHRLKNKENLTYKALDSLRTKVRVIISGTPIQNDLTEYYSLLDFVNPGVLGTESEFRKNFELPITNGRFANCSPEEEKKCIEATNTLNEIVSKFVIRRSNQLNKKYLPSKLEQVVFCKMTPPQASVYESYLKFKGPSLRAYINANEGVEGGGIVKGASLEAVNTLKKLVNHPALIYDQIARKDPGFEHAHDILPEAFIKNKSFSKDQNDTLNPMNFVKNASSSSNTEYFPELSGKIKVLDQMLSLLKVATKDKVVIVSNYTRTLNFFETMCKARSYGYLRLDGTLSIKNRQKLVDRFNTPDAPEFIFLLSSKAGGCGLNLIGANRLVLFDPDWNPATDLQAMARVWRDGQKKQCYIYRMVTTGTLEEKIFQRQAHKLALSTCIVDEEEDVNRHFTGDDLRALFSYSKATLSDTHDAFKCKRCVNGMAIAAPASLFAASKSNSASTADKTSAAKDEKTQYDMSKWNHYAIFDKLEDQILKKSCGDSVSFVFMNKFDKPE